MIVNCDNVYIGETGRAIQEKFKEHERDVRLAHTETSAVSEHANKTGHSPDWKNIKFLCRDSRWYSRRVKKAIQISLLPNNMDSGIEIPHAWTNTKRKHSERTNHRAGRFANRFRSWLDQPTTALTPELRLFSQPTLSPDEDLHVAVATSRSFQRQDNRINTFNCLYRFPRWIIFY